MMPVREIRLRADEIQCVALDVIALRSDDMMTPPCHSVRGCYAGTGQSDAACRVIRCTCAGALRRIGSAVVPTPLEVSE